MGRHDGSDDKKTSTKLHDSMSLKKRREKKHAKKSQKKELRHASSDAMDAA